MPIENEFLCSRQKKKTFNFICLQVPTIAFLDGVNVDPTVFTYGVPGNCDSPEFVRGVLHVMAVAHSFGRTLPTAKEDSAPHA